MAQERPGFPSGTLGAGWGTACEVLLLLRKHGAESLQRASACQGGKALLKGLPLEASASGEAGKLAEEAHSLPKPSLKPPRPASNAEQAGSLRAGKQLVLSRPTAESPTPYVKRSWLSFGRIWKRHWGTARSSKLRQKWRKARLALCRRIRTRTRRRARNPMMYRQERHVQSKRRNVLLNR